ncbi:MAG: SRPBCC domain-containing protein [Saprospiraceae bacterium]
MPTIYHHFIIKSTPVKVYDAVSNAVHLENWWPLKCSGKPFRGEIYNFNFTDEYDWFGKVILAEPGKSFYVEMTHADIDWDYTSFGFDLIEIPEGTAVEFWHKEWPELNQHFKIASYCWAI